MIEGDSVVHEVRYEHPVERVWRALTDANELAGWLMANDFAPEPGRRFRLDARPAFGILECEVLDVDAPHRLRCRWIIEGAPSILTITLRPDGPDENTTVLRLEHRAIPPEPRRSFDGGWGAKLTHDLPLVLDGTRAAAAARVADDALARHPDLEV